MNKIVSLSLLASGMALIDFGVSATHSLSWDVSEFLMGSPTNKAVWMLIGGIVAAVLGLANFSRPPKNA